MATYLGTGAVFQVQSTATAGNVNGGGFNPANTHFPTDGVIAGGTGATPTISPTSSYAFVTLDATNGAWVFFPVQTGVTYPMWAQINTVSGGVATLKADVGQLVQIINNRYVTNTVAGIASTATPTLTYGVDYSQQDTAQYSSTTLTGATTSATDAAGNPFTSNMIGNFICAKSGTGVTAGWYEITNVVAGTATLDRTAGTTYSAVVSKIGGAVSLGGSTAGITDVIFFALGSNAATSGCRFFFKGGSSITYTISAAPTALTGNAAWHSILEGFSTIRGDRPAGATRPTLNIQAASFTAGGSSKLYSLIFTSSVSSQTVNSGSVTSFFFCKILNTSTSANAIALRTLSAPSTVIGCEAISYNGYACRIGGTDALLYGCYFHDSKYGIDTNGSINAKIINCIIACNFSGAINAASVAYTGGTVVSGCTLYGAENKLGTGFNAITGTTSVTFINNIIYGFVTGVTDPDVQAVIFDDYNCYFNNTNDVNAAANWQKGQNDIAVNPSFTSVTQRTGSTATTTAGNHLVQSGATFVTWGITAGTDCIYISAGTGVTAGIYGILSVDSETQITVDITLTANATADKTWSITQGHNFLPTGAI